MEETRLVRDYLGVSRDTLESFTRQFPHPFLIMTQQMSDVERGDEEAFFTAKLDQTRLAELKAVAEGRILNPDAPVFCVQKRTDVQKGTGVITAGRASNCDIVLISKVISKLHFYLSAGPCSEDKYLLADGGSTNGTQINGVRLAPHERVTVESGDVVLLSGEVRLQFFLSRGFWGALQKIPACYDRRTSVGSAPVSLSS